MHVDLVFLQLDGKSMKSSAFKNTDGELWDWSNDAFPLKLCCILICMRNHNDGTKKTSDTVLFEKYTSHYIERVVCEWELETEQNCNILTPTLLAITAFVSRSPWLLNRGPVGPASLGHVPQSSIFSSTGLISKLLNRGPEGSRCWVLAFSTAVCLNWSSLQTNWLPVFTGLYNSSTSTVFLWASQIALIQPIHGQGHTLLFLDRTHLLFTLVHFLFWLPGRVVGEYTTTIPDPKKHSDFFS